jgi:hypothetical protein
MRRNAVIGSQNICLLIIHYENIEFLWLVIEYMFSTTNNECVRGDIYLQPIITIRLRLKLLLRDLYYASDCSWNRSTDICFSLCLLWTTVHGSKV